MRIGAVALGGLVGGAIAVGLAARVTNRQLALRAANLRALLETQGSNAELVLTAQGAEAQRVLEVHAMRVAEQAARQHLDEAYHIGPDEITRMRQLGEHFS